MRISKENEDLKELKENPDAQRINMQLA